MGGGPVGVRYLQSCNPPALPSPPFSMLPSQFYWIGLGRESSDTFWAYVDGTTLPQVASNSPYAHWSWNMNSYTYDSAKAAWNCIMVGLCLFSAGLLLYRQQHAQALCSCIACATTIPGTACSAQHQGPWRRCLQARKDVAYDLYMGTSAPADQTDRNMYATTSMDRLYGWQSQDCTLAAPSLCEIPASAFPCFPPPSPPTPPPLPPSPPSPPLAAICEWLSTSSAIQAGLQPCAALIRCLLLGLAPAARGTGCSTQHMPAASRASQCVVCSNLLQARPPMAATSSAILFPACAST